MTSMVLKLKRLKGEVKKWEKLQTLKQGKELANLKMELQHLYSLFPSGILLDIEAQKLVSIKSRKEKILAHEVLTWRLKIWAIWIDHGDANTNFFHSFSSTRRNINYI